MRARTLGQPAAQNLGIEAAVGQYILFLDSDALALARNGLARLVERMDADPRIGIAGCRVVNGYTRKLDQWIYAEPAETSALVEFKTYSFSAAGAIARAEALRKAGQFWDDLIIYNGRGRFCRSGLHRAGYKGGLYYPTRPSIAFPLSRGRKRYDKRCPGTIRSATGSGFSTAIIRPRSGGERSCFTQCSTWSREYSTASSWRAGRGLSQG